MIKFLLKVCLMPCLMVLYLSSTALAAPLGELLEDDAFVKALSSPKVRDRDAVIQTLSSDLSDDGIALLQDLAAGRLYADGSKIYKEEGKSYTALSGPDVLTSKKGLKRIGTSNAQRSAIAALANSYSLQSPDDQKRARSVHALLEIGAQLPDIADLERLMDQENVRSIYKDLRCAWALAMAQKGDAGVQRTLEAVEILEDLGTPAALQALNLLKERALDGAVIEEAQSSIDAISFYQGCARAAENLFFGLSLGSVLVLAAIGLAITFGVMGVINMAHGELIMIGAYCVWILQQLMPSSPGLALLLSIPTAFVVSGAVGMLIERTVISKLYGRPLETLLATFGISLILQQAVRTIFSPLNRAVQTPEFMQGSIQLTQNFSVTLSRVCIIVFCILTFALILTIMNNTSLGLQVRAVSQNRPTARAMGIRAGRVDALTFGLGSGAAGMAGVALSQITNVGPNLGQNYIIDTFMVVVFGGAGNLWGTLCGGLIMGLISKFLEPLSGAMLSKIIILIALILFIQKRPKGLFPVRGRAAE